MADDSEASETPNVKKSNIVARELYPESPPRQKESKEVVVIENDSRESPGAPLIPTFKAQTNSLLTKLSLQPIESSIKSSIKAASVEAKTDVSPIASPRSKQENKPEEVRVIKAKDLAEDRILEKKRLNKLLTIFEDQKPIK